MMLFVAVRWSVAASLVLCVVRCLVFVVCCVLFARCRCLLFVVCWTLLLVGCWLVSVDRGCLVLCWGGW